MGEDAVSSTGSSFRRHGGRHRRRSSGSGAVGDRRTVPNRFDTPMIPDARCAPGARRAASSPGSVGAFPVRIACARIGWRYLPHRSPPVRAPRAEITHMTPTPPRPTDKKTSGNPATQAQIAQTVKQQREQKRQEKLAEYQRQLAKRRRSKLVWWTVGVVVADRRHRRDRRLDRLRTRLPRRRSSRATATARRSRASRPSRTPRTTSRARSTTRSHRPPAATTTPCG